jgi:hypothetical protein
MSKNDATRLTDTIAFIRGATVPPAHANKRAAVADLLADREATHRIPDTISPAMSQGSNYTIVGRDQVKEQRHYRRAIILVRAALLGTDRNFAAGEVNQIADASLPAALGTVLDEVTTQLADLNLKLNQLRNDPLAFLTNNSFNMVGEATSGPMDYDFYYDKLGQLYVLTLKEKNQIWVSVPVNVFHLHVQKYAGLGKPAKAGGHWLDVDGTVVVGAPDLMVTTQLTGCAIVYHLNGANLVAAHVQPSADVNAEAICTNLRADGRLSKAPGKTVTGVFGAQLAKGGDPKNYLKVGNRNYCVGVKSGGNWDLYAQQRPGGLAVGGLNVAWKIT